MREINLKSGMEMKQIRKELVDYCSDEKQMKLLANGFHNKELIQLLRQTFDASIDCLEKELNTYDGNVSEKVSALCNTLDTIPLFLMDKDQSFWSDFDQNIMS